MATAGQQLKSKTVQFNAIAAAVFTILGAVGITVEQEVVAAIITVGNYVLRLVTKQPLSEK